MTKPSKYPIFGKIEYYLAQFKLIALAIDYLIHRPFFIWQKYLSDRRTSSDSICKFESKIFSQNGEDGIILEIFNRIGVVNGKGYAVEFGIEDGSECCTRNLFVNYDWNGLLIEGNQSSVYKAQLLYKNLPKVKIICKFIEADNILSIFEEYEVPHSIDLLVIDIDGNDFWILRKILSFYKPRAMVIEYNGKFIPPKEWIMPYDPKHCWDGSAYFGASLQSLAKLAQSENYCLIGCESRGVNAFFVQNELADKFTDYDKSACYHYIPPSYGSGFGYPFRSRSISHLARNLNGQKR